MSGSRIYINAVLKSGEVSFQDCISFLENNSEIDYFQQTNKDLKITGSLFGSFHIYNTSLSASLDDYENITFNTPCYRYTQSNNGPERLSTLFEFVSDLYEAVGPLYVYGVNNWRIEGWEEGQTEYKTPPVISDGGIENNRIEHPTWLMLFPPEMVAEYGREWLLDLPAETIEELDDGAIMIVATGPLPECENEREIVELIDDAMTPIEEAFAQREL